jgi:hypothetical protein
MKTKLHLFTLIHAEPVSVLTFDTGFMARRCRQDFGGVAGQERCDGQAEAGEDAAESGSEQSFSTIRRGEAGGKAET